MDLALQGLPPAELTAIRLLIAGLIMALLASPRRLLVAICANLTKFLVLALLGFTLPNLFFAAAMQTVPISVVSFIANSYPALAMALAVISLGERPTRLHVAGIAWALVRLYLMAGVQPGQAIAPGIVLVFLASLGWAVSSIASKKLAVTVSSSVIVAGRHLLAGLLAIPLMASGGVRSARPHPSRGLRCWAW